MLVYFSVSLIALLGFVGLAVDVGRMELRTIQLQTFADDGAVTAAAELQRPNAAWQTVTTNEIANSLTQNNLPPAVVTFQQSAGAGPYSNDFAAVQISVTQQFPLFFMGLLTLNNNATVSAKALALAPPCAFFMNASRWGLEMATATIHSACSLYANYGMLIDSTATFDVQAKVSGSPSQGGQMGGTFYYPMIYNSPVLADPLAYIVAPVFQGCNHNAVNYTTPQTISPGTYCGGFTVTGTTVQMQPGLYIITGGVSITNGATLSGSGVTMYLTQGGGSGFGTFRLINSSMHVNAPTVGSGGSIAGIVLMGDRNWSGGTLDFQFATYGYPTSYLGDGIIYTTNTGILDWQMNLSCNNYFTVVTDSMDLYGSTFSPQGNFSSLPGGNPLHIAASLVQ